MRLTQQGKRVHADRSETRSPGAHGGKEERVIDLFDVTAQQDMDGMHTRLRLWLRPNSRRRSKVEFPIAIWNKINPTGAATINRADNGIYVEDASVEAAIAVYPRRKRN